MGWGVVGLLAVGAGGIALWHGATLQGPEGTDPDAFRMRRRRWIVAGGVFVIAGVLAIRKGS